MAVHVVDVLEVIEIDRHDPEREPVAHRCGQLVSRPGLDRATVRQAGQRIGQRKVLEQPVLLFELTIQVDQTQADLDAGQQFFGVNGLGR